MEEDEGAEVQSYTSFCEQHIEDLVAQARCLACRFERRLGSNMALLHQLVESNADISVVEAQAEHCRTARVEVGLVTHTCGRTDGA